MNFNTFNLESLQSLHISYKNVLNNQIELLNNLPENEDEKIISEVLKLKIASLEDDITEIETRINELNAEKLRFSTEYMLWNFGVFEKSVQVHFLTTSNAYKTYGQYVTGIVLFDKANLLELTERLKNEENTDGIIKFEEIVSTEMTADIKEELKNVGFYASEIDSIYRVA